MTYSIVNDETGREFTFPTEAKYEAALDWYNATTKKAAIEFCAARGINLLKNDTTLVDDWADAAMECWANSK